MRKIYFIMAMLVLCAYGAKAQALEPRTVQATVNYPDSIIQYPAEGRSGVKTKKSHEYWSDQDKNSVCQVIASYWDNGRWNNSEKTITATDIKGYAVLSETYNNNGGIWMPANTESFMKRTNRYDDLGNLTSRDIYRWNSDSLCWDNDVRYEYTNDSLGNVEYSRRDVWSKDLGEWKFQSEESNIRYTDSLNRVVLLERYNRYAPDDSSSVVPEWYNVMNTEYGYDEWGNVIQMKSFIMGSDGTRRYQTMANHTYDSNRNMTFYEYFTWPSTDSTWRCTSKIVSDFDENNNLLSREYSSWNTWLNRLTERDRNYYTYTLAGLVSSDVYHFWNEKNEEWEISSKTIYSYNSEGNVNLSKYYNWWYYGEIGWHLMSYMRYYPDTYDSENGVEVEETVPVTEDNKGKFELTLMLPSEATITGSFEVEFPEGMVLDSVATALVADLATNFSLEFTQKSSNVWLIEIKSSTLRSSQNEVLFKKIMDVGYKVVNPVSAGTYSIEVTDVEFETSTGETISQDLLTVNVEVRNTTGLEQVAESQSVAYVSKGVLVVNNQLSESIDVYSAMGVKLLTVWKEVGKTEYDINNLSEGILIIKGSSGWIVKVIDK